MQLLLLFLFAPSVPFSFGASSWPGLLLFRELDLEGSRETEEEEVELNDEE